MGKNRKYWHQMNFVEWMWQEHKTISILMVANTILVLMMIVLGLFYV